MFAVLIFPPQDVKNASSTKESLDDLFPTEDEEQSQSKTAEPAVVHLERSLGMYSASSTEMSGWE